VPSKSAPRLLLSKSNVRTPKNSLRTKFVNKGKKKRKGREGERYSGPVNSAKPQRLSVRRR
jgi:hypothetical protein